VLDLIPDNGKLVATDLNPGMLEVAREKLNSDKIQWQIANAQELPFVDAEFDHIVCQFGVMFFPDKQQSFKEAYRVLQPGGKYLFNTWESIDKNPRIDLMLKVMLEVFGNETPDFLQKGPHSFFHKNEIEQLLINAGFKNVRIESVATAPKYTRPDDLVKGFADGSPLANYLKEKQEEVQIIFRKRFQEALDEQDKVFGNTVPLLALVIEATK
jgi:ubiquinone/menaquinone biosynthesis C-methylase UbiE